MILRTLTTVAFTGAAIVLGAASAQATSVRHATGPTYVYDHALDGVGLQITVVSVKRGTTVSMSAWNFPEASYGKAYGAHVHVRPCTSVPADAGPHYQNPAGTTLEQKEIWLDFTVDDHGRARSRAFRPWHVPAGAAGSVVVHAEATHPDGTAGARQLCTTVPF